MVKFFSQFFISCVLCCSTAYAEDKATIVGESAPKPITINSSQTEIDAAIAEGRVVPSACSRKDKKVD